MTNVYTPTDDDGIPPGHVMRTVAAEGTDTKTTQLHTNRETLGISIKDIRLETFGTRLGYRSRISTSGISIKDRVGVTFGIRVPVCQAPRRQVTVECLTDQ